MLRRPSCFTPLFKPFHWLPIWLPIKARVLNVALPDPGPASPSHPRPRVRVPLPAWNVLPLPTSFSPLRYWLKPLLACHFAALSQHTRLPRAAPAPGRSFVHAHRLHHPGRAAREGLCLFCSEKEHQYQGCLAHILLNT